MTENNPKTQFKALTSLTRRHLLVFLKNVPTVIFTLMVPLTIFAIYVLFLRNMEISQITGALDSAGIVIDKASREGKDFLHQIYGIADSWMIAGVLSVSCITVSLNSNYILVKDKERGIAKDFISSPIKSEIITLSYLLFNIIITFVTVLLVYFICLIFLLCYGANMISFAAFLAIIGIILLSTMSAALITFFVCSFISSDSVMSPIVAIVSAAVGFLVDAYLPAGLGPKYIQTITTFFPGTYSTGLFRNYLLNGPLDLLKKSPVLQGSSGGIEFVTVLENQFSLNINFFGLEITPGYMVLVIFLCMIVFTVLNIFFTSKNYMNFLKKRSHKSKKKKADSNSK